MEKMRQKIDLEGGYFDLQKLCRPPRSGVICEDLGRTQYKIGSGHGATRIVKKPHVVPDDLAFNSSDDEIDSFSFKNQSSSRATPPVRRTLKKDVSSGIFFTVGSSCLSYCPRGWLQWRLTQIRNLPRLLRPPRWLTRRKINNHLPYDPKLALHSKAPRHAPYVAITTKCHLLINSHSIQSARGSSLLARMTTVPSLSRNSAPTARRGRNAPRNTSLILYPSRCLTNVVTPHSRSRLHIPRRSPWPCRLLNIHRESQNQCHSLCGLLRLPALKLWPPVHLDPSLSIVRALHPTSPIQMISRTS